MRSFFRFLTVPALLAFLMLLTIAAAPAAPAQPNQPTAVATSNAGEVSVSWDAASGAQFYTVGWINKDEFDEMQAAGRDWLDAFHYATIPASYTTHTISGLKSSSDYYAIIGAQTSRFGGEQPVWSAWSGKVTTSGEHGAGFCPITGIPLPPTGYLTIGDTATFDLGSDSFIDVKLESATIYETVEFDDGEQYYAPAGFEWLDLCVTVTNRSGNGESIYYSPGSHNNLSTDSGIGFIGFSAWEGYSLEDGFQNTGCELWTVPEAASTAVYAVHYIDDPLLFQIRLP